MNKLVRVMATTCASAVLLGVSACAVGGGGDSEEGSPEPQAGGGPALEQFDPCTFFDPAELASWELPERGEDFTPVSFEPGCTWSGENMVLTFQKNVEETVDSYETNGSWERYDKTSIGGRSAASANAPGSSDTGGCNVLVDAGGGVAIYGVSGKLADSVDACAEAKKIASESAAELPK